MRQKRNDKRLTEEVHDPYRERGKRVEPCSCPGCGAVVSKGRWSWRKTDMDGVAQGAPCPACRRIEDDYPAGLVHLGGAFLAEHREEILGLVRNIEARESADHPLKRLMGIEEDGDGLLVKTTDVHLARAVGDALKRAYGGTLEGGYAGSAPLRMRWSR